MNNDAGVFIAFAGTLISLLVVYLSSLLSEFSVSREAKRERGSLEKMERMELHRELAKKISELESVLAYRIMVRTMSGDRMALRPPQIPNMPDQLVSKKKGELMGYKPPPPLPRLAKAVTTDHFLGKQKRIQSKVPEPAEVLQRSICEYCGRSNKNVETCAGCGASVG